MDAISLTPPSKPKGYRLVRIPDHPRAKGHGQIYEHVFIAEQALGHYLPDGVEVHHVDENPRNNTRTNLVICQDQAYHMLLHRRARVLRAGGNPNTQGLCYVCKMVKDLTSFNKSTRRRSGYQTCCAECGRANSRRRRQIGAVSS